MLSNRELCLSVMDEEFRPMIIGVPKMVGDMAIAIARKKLSLLSKPVLRDYKTINESVFSDENKEFLSRMMLSHRNRLKVVIDREVSPLVVMERFDSLINSSVIKSYISGLLLDASDNGDDLARIKIMDEHIDSLVRTMNNYYSEVKDFVMELHEGRVMVDDVDEVRLEELDNKYTQDKRDSKGVGIFIDELSRDYRVYVMGIV